MAISRIDELRMVDPVLTTIAQGYQNSAFIADKLFPVVQVSKLKGKIPYFGKEAFINRDTFRAIRADSNRIPPSGMELIEYETKERDVEVAVDYLEEEESPDFFSYEQRLAKELVDLLNLGKEIEASQLVQDASNYPTGSKLEVQQSNAFDDYTNTTDPIEIIKDAMGTVRSKIARYPNIMVLGDKAFNSIADHPKILERIKYSHISSVTKDILKQILNLDEIHIGMGVYTTTGDNFVDIWGDNIILAYSARSNAKNSQFEPSFGYTLQRSGKPEIDTYYENGGKIKVIRNTDNYCIKATSWTAGFLIEDVNHND